MTSPIRRLLAGRTLAALATALIPTTLTLAVVRTGSATDLGLVLSCELLPMLVLLPVAGVVADRFPPQRVVFTADLVRATAQLAIGAELLGGGLRIPDLAVLSAITGAAVAFGTPAVRTLVAAVVTGAERLRTNAQLGAAQGLAQIAAPAAAGGLMLLVGAGWSSLLTGALFIASASTLGGLRPDRSLQRAERSAFLGELREGWAETRRHPWFLANVLGHGVWHLTAGVLLTLGPLITVRHLGGDTAWVVIAEVGTVGTVAGVYAASRLPIRQPLVGVAVGAAVFALPLTAFALLLPVPVVTAAYFAGMFGVGVLNPLWETTMQRRIPPEALGRVGSFDTLISFAARPLGLAVAAPLAAGIGTTTPLLLGAALVGTANLAVLLLPTVRETTRAPLPAAEQAC
ncbi:MFS transporter [Kitasatospora aureofaciens]|uniref:MFS transporter n=1 Tax=Kitasatospora aureofaciens TaxID=1894 RepID=A0A1E7NGR7_KITAU|nr:MFS transporter [Kitasatospora aureofaciens]OEV39848.1 MFS transporter [Kitasatospora aureofaciens]UKZ10182.1 MFS transporter [Streptomyces viridifaciens]